MHALESWILQYVSTLPQERNERKPPADEIFRQELVQTKGMCPGAGASRVRPRETMVAYQLTGEKDSR